MCGVWLRLGSFQTPFLCFQQLGGFVPHFLTILFSPSSLNLPKPVAKSDLASFRCADTPLWHRHSCRRDVPPSSARATPPGVAVPPSGPGPRMSSGVLSDRLRWRCGTAGHGFSHCRGTSTFDLFGSGRAGCGFSIFGLQDWRRHTASLNLLRASPVRHAITRLFFVYHTSPGLSRAGAAATRIPSTLSLFGRPPLFAGFSENGRGTQAGVPVPQPRQECLCHNAGSANLDSWDLSRRAKESLSSSWIRDREAAGRVRKWG